MTLRRASSAEFPRSGMMSTSFIRSRVGWECAQSSRQGWFSNGQIFRWRPIHQTGDLLSRGWARGDTAGTSAHPIYVCPSMARENLSRYWGCSTFNHRPIGRMVFPASPSVLQRLRELTSKMESAGPTIHGERNGGWKCRQGPPARVERIEAGEKAGTAAKTLRGSAKLGMAKLRPLSWGIAFTFTERNAEFNTDAAQPAIASPMISLPRRELGSFRSELTRPTYGRARSM